MMDPIIFIDTNIYLDFYRIRNSEVRMSFLDHLEKKKSIIVSTSQVEMEYKKHRQKVILESLGKLKTPDWSGLTPPAFLSAAKPVNAVNRAKDTISKKSKEIKERIAAVLETPYRNDKVYQSLQRIFKHSSDNNLARDKKIRFQIRRAAWKRFMLGYPPKKPDDITIGDAVNWEWIVHCSKVTGKDVIIVSRDNDYGITYGDKSILNDWLFQEFKERVSKKREILLTDKLSVALKLASVSVSKVELEAEKTLITEVKEEKVLSTDEKVSNLANLLKKWEELLTDYKGTKDEAAKGEK